jgi:hypothetical protein
MNERTLAYVQRTIAKNIVPPSLNVHRPMIAVYVRRSDKIQYGEMSKAYSLDDYVQLFHKDMSRTNTTTIYLNSEDTRVFDEFTAINTRRGHLYRLLMLRFSRNLVFRTIAGLSPPERETVVLQFLSDLFIEVHADLHAGTLTSNWCRLIDEIRLTLGKTIAFYTPEHSHYVEA